MNIFKRINITSINRKELIISLNDERFRRRNIQSVANALFPNIAFTTLDVKKFPEHFTKISNGFMTAKTIAKRLRDDLDLDVHPSTVPKSQTPNFKLQFNIYLLVDRVSE